MYILSSFFIFYYFNKVMSSVYLNVALIVYIKYFVLIDATTTRMILLPFMLIALKTKFILIDIFSFQ